MSARPRRRRAAWAAAVLVLLLAAASLWAFVPRGLGPVAVGDARVLRPGEPDGGTKPAGLATPERLAVTFRVPRDLAAERERLGLGYVAARLGDCAGERGYATEVASQGAGYLGDYGRVRRLPSPGGGARYRAVFDDALLDMRDHRAVRARALDVPGGLCLSLYGARMWFGTARSAAVPVSFRR